MNTQVLEYIIAISEEKSLSKAADRLLVTQPALTQQVKKLEKELDARLFRREKNELVLTDAGKVYVNGARSVLNIYHNACKEIKRMKDSGKKQITIVYNNALLPSFTTRVLAPFTELHKDVFLSTIDGNTAVAKDYLTSSMADIAVIATKDLSHSMLEYVPLRKEELMLAIPADHPCVSRFEQEGVDLRSLKEEYFILNQNNSYFRILEKEIFANSQFAPNILCEISDLNASKNMVMNRRGNAFLPKAMDCRDGSCRCFSLNPPASFQTVIAFHKGKVLSRAIKDLVMLLLKAYEQADLK